MIKFYIDSFAYWGGNELGRTVASLWHSRKDPNRSVKKFQREGRDCSWADWTLHCDWFLQDIDEVDRYKDINPWDLRNNYREKLHNLLYTEEAQQKKLIRRYDKRFVR